jgi:hypothetical protein
MGVAMRVCLAMDAKDRWDGKLDRLLHRVEKLGKELAKSGLSAEDKAELWECFWSFCSGMAVDLERQYPELKGEQASKRAKAKRTAKQK